MNICNLNELNELNERLKNYIANSKEFSNKKLVFGDGNINSKIILIGEAPGGEEEKQGKPFVGAAGKNLLSFLKILEITREDIYITNVVKIRPTKLSEKTKNIINRTPNEMELNLFIPFLIKEIKMLTPKLIITLGNIPLKAITKKDKIGIFHGQILEYKELIVFPLYHPASIIYNPSIKDIYLADLEKLKLLVKKIL